MYRRVAKIDSYGVVQVLRTSQQWHSIVTRIFIMSFFCSRIWIAVPLLLLIFLLSVSSKSVPGLSLLECIHFEQARLKNDIASFPEHGNEAFIMLVTFFFVGWGVLGITPRAFCMLSPCSVTEPIPSLPSGWSYWCGLPDHFVSAAFPHWKSYCLAFALCFEAVLWVSAILFLLVLSSSNFSIHLCISCNNDHCGVCLMIFLFFFHIYQLEIHPIYIRFYSTG